MRTGLADFGILRVSSIFKTVQVRLELAQISGQISFGLFYFSGGRAVGPDLDKAQASHTLKNALRP